jgi:hypothetical protein
LSPAKRIPREWITGLALAAVTLAVYWPVRNHAFINYDDPVYVTGNRHVQAGISRPGLAWAFLNLHGEHTYWHPVTWVSHMLDCQLFGLNPGPHHLVNVAFHIANALLLLLALHRMTGALWRSAMVAGLFALHPLQVDTVAWVTERKNVLSTFFWLLTLWAYVRYAEGKMQKSRTEHPISNIQHPTSSFYLLSLVFFALGLMCKPALVTLPFVLLLLDYWPLGRMQNDECRMMNAKFRSPATRNPQPASCFTPHSPPGKASVPRASGCRGFHHRRGSSRTPRHREPPMGVAGGECAGLLCPLPRQDVLANPFGRVLSASRRVAGGGGRRERTGVAGSVWLGDLAGAPGALLSHWLALVFGRAGADGRDYPGGQPGDG